MFKYLHYVSLASMLVCIYLIYNVDLNSIGKLFVGGIFGVSLGQFLSRFYGKLNIFAKKAETKIKEKKEEMDNG